MTTDARTARVRRALARPLRGTGAATRGPVLAVLAVLALVALLSPSSAGAAEHSAEMRGNAYLPETMTVKVGDQVTWTNNDPDTHSVVGGGMNSPDIPPKGTFSYRFTEPGEVTYTCRFHSYMQGTIKVQPAGASGTGAGGTGSSPAPAPASSPPPNRDPAPPPAGTDPAAGHGGPQGRPEGGLGDGTRLAEFTSDDGVKVFRLTMAPTHWEVAPGDTRDAYAFNGIVPGPVIRVNEGDRVRMVVENDLPVATAVHWHGMILPNDQDGVPGVTQPAIQPGQRYVYEWTAVATGTHWYHAHSSGKEVGKGLYGALEVVPRAGDIPVDRDYRLLLGDSYLGFVLNGRSFPATVPLQARVGERVRIRLVGTGESSHPIHLHGFPFEVVAQDGQPLPLPQKMDTLLVSPGQTFDLLVTPRSPGRWLLHCHIFAHSETDHGMTGLVTTLDVSPADGPLPVPVPGSAT